MAETILTGRSGRRSASHSNHPQGLLLNSKTAQLLILEQVTDSHITELLIPFQSSIRVA